MTTRNRPDAKDADCLLILALASGSPYRDAAKQAGVGVSTVSRRMREHDFRVRVSEQRGQLIERGAGRMADEFVASIEFLANVRDDGDESTALRVRAATGIISFTLRYRQIDPSPLPPRTMAEIQAAHIEFADGAVDEFW